MRLCRARVRRGAGGNLWFTERGLLPGIGRITPTGAITEYPASLLMVPGDITAGVTGLTAGDDGDLWFAEADRGKLGRMTTDGDVTEYDLGLSGDEALKDLTNGPDGWMFEPDLLQVVDDTRGDDQVDPGVDVLTLGQSTPAGATERIHSRNSLPPTRA